MNCPRCGQSTEQDGKWPLKDGDDYIDGCYTCFEAEASENWWACVDMMREPYQKLARGIVWKAEQLGFTQSESEEIAEAFLWIDNLPAMPKRCRHWIHQLAERQRAANRLSCN